jgi:hypothetical protein
VGQSPKIIRFFYFEDLNKVPTNLISSIKLKETHIGALGRVWGNRTSKKPIGCRKLYARL